MSTQKKRQILMLIVGIFCLIGEAAVLLSMKQQKAPSTVVCYTDFDRDGYPSQKITAEFKKEEFTECPATMITARFDGKFDSLESDNRVNLWNTELLRNGKDD